MARKSSNESKKSNLLLEELPEIKENLICETEESGGFLAIAQLQEEIFLTKDKEKILSMAQRLNSAYNTDFLAELESKSEEFEKDFQEHSNNANENVHTCNNCFGEAEKKCSNCRAVYYCCR